MCVCISDMLDENQSKLSEDLMEFRRDASMLNVSVCRGYFVVGGEIKNSSLSMRLNCLCK